MLLLWELCGVAVAQESGSTDEPATSVDMERAAEAFGTGESLFQEGNYEAAILAFKESLALSGKSEIHFNLAYCMELLGRLDEAYAELERYRKVVPEDQRVALDRRLQAIRGRIDAQAASARVPMPVVAPAPSVLAAPEPVRLHAADWVFVGSGAAVGVFSLTGVGLTYSSAARHLEEDNRPAYSVDRALNVTSWLGTTVGAGLIITGVVRASATRVSFDGDSVTLHGTF